jgi:kumamolisin
LLVNPGFESGHPLPWTASAGVVIRESADQPAWGGSWLARLDSQNEILDQLVSIPATCHATLSFWLNIDTVEKTKRIDYDTLVVTLRSPTGEVLATLDTFSNREATAGYQKNSYDVSGYAGSQVAVTFDATENSNRQTSFLLDYITLSVS